MSKKEKNKLPNKKTMNLYQPTSKDDPKAVVTIGIGAIIIVILGLVVFTILPKITEINEAKLEVAELSETSSVYHARIAKYNALQQEYYRYAEIYSDGEEELVNRVDIIDMLIDKSQGVATNPSIIIVGNNVALNVVTSDLATLADYEELLLESPMVTKVRTSLAAKNDGQVVATTDVVVVKDGE